MGCLLTVEAKKSREIDYRLRKDGDVTKNETKLLLLGPGESGKSTIFKQMKIIQDDGGFSIEEKLEYRYIIFGNCISQMKVLVTAAINNNIQPQLAENEARFEKLSKISPGGNSWTLEVAEDIRCLWRDEGIQQVYKMRDKHFQLNDSAAYFFDNISRFANDTYVPSQDDVLRSRVRTTGIQEAHFKFNDIEFRMLDVGGQRSERRKWIHCFDSVTAVIFCVALSEYDQTLREEESQNRMKESLLLFDEIVNSHWFRNTAFIIFFNKVDLFREKIQKIDLGETFPLYKDGFNFDSASQFIKKMFLDQAHSQQMMFTHFTCAIDTDNIQFVFKAVREALLKNVITSIIHI
ncbi:G-protein subunit alpha 5 [Tieghemostelium lacteum]|uniref:G-protein subunit alpha 5 n=1 Tax=Tieghemostelium lacteum TaxID=361077 RepID=A0A152A468_TIELA|nr:G-protein subunit alpha 5 [Tieghemostelium lacteum]|eukprot:KYR01014.1 G-protein subunit alpha 5 [Tieghemostelium lacteum]